MKIHSILVTGTDLVGKTTLIERLVPHLKNRGHNVATNKDDLYKTPMMALARSLLSSESPQNLLEQNGILFLTFLIDAHNYRADTSSILIQDSYACRTAAFARAHGLTILDDLFEEYRENILRVRCHYSPER